MIFTCFLLALASGNPKDRVPYKSIKDSQVCGFPSGLTFGPPSSFSTSDLKVILDKADDISFCKFRDMSNKVSVFCKFYTSKYCSLLFEYSFPFNTQNMFHKASDLKFTMVTFHIYSWYITRTCICSQIFIVYALDCTEKTPCKYGPVFGPYLHDWTLYGINTVQKWVRIYMAFFLCWDYNIYGKIINKEL